MRISINADIKDGPWGGGNQAVKSIRDGLLAKGHTVMSHIKERDIDLILMVHPSRYPGYIDYGVDEIRRYKALYPNTILLHRVNTSGDVHKGRGRETKVLLKANTYADYTVFISSFLKDLYVDKGFDPKRPNKIILNGADKKVFNSQNKKKYTLGEKIKIVTHHWSSNYNKGFDIYKRLDILLGEKRFKDIFEFTFIGNVPRRINFVNSRVINPLSGEMLSEEIKRNHVYLTASRNEGAGMHHIEGMMCGLPVLYIKSGALPEYCSFCGIGFEEDDFEGKLLKMKERYLELREKVKECHYSSDVMAAQYVTLIEDLILSRQKAPIPAPGSGIVFKERVINGFILKLKRAYFMLKKMRSNFMKRMLCVHRDRHVG